MERVRARYSAKIVRMKNEWGEEEKKKVLGLVKEEVDVILQRTHSRLVQCPRIALQCALVWSRYNLQDHFFTK